MSNKIVEIRQQSPTDILYRPSGLSRHQCIGKNSMQHVTCTKCHTFFLTERKLGLLSARVVCRTIDSHLRREIAHRVVLC